MWRHGSTRSQICGHSHQCGTTAGPLRYYRGTPAVLPLSGSTAMTTVLPYLQRLKPCPTCLLCSPFSGLLHLICFCVFVSVCFGVWSGDGSHSHLKRKAQVTGKASSSSTKRTAHKEKVKEKPVFELPLPEYRDYRRVNPYNKPHDPSLMKTKF